jgi:hypothetical protein
MLLIQNGLKMSHEEEEILHTFICFLLKFLEIPERPRCVAVVADRGKFGIKTTAAFHPHTSIIKVLGSGRSLPDIMRSCAHELVHFRQMLHGELDRYPHQDIGGYLEDQASSGASAALKAFSYLIGPDIVYKPRPRTDRSVVMTVKQLRESILREFKVGGK